MKKYVNTGTTPVDLESGRPVGVGEEVELPDRLSAHDRLHVTEGRLTELGLPEDPDIPSNHENVVDSAKSDGNNSQSDPPPVDPDASAPQPENVPPPRIGVGSPIPRTARTTKPSNEGGES